MNLKERVARELRQAIVRGEYQPGAHLTEAALSERFKVSRTPIREALNQLEKEGFVKIVPAAGARVVALSPEQILDIYELLSILEGAACRLACKHITDEEIRKLEEYNFLFEKAVEEENEELTFRINWQFHWLITEATHNSYLVEVRSNFRELVDRIGRVSPRIPAQVKASLQEHRRLTEALKARNAALSEFIMREHLDGAKKRIAAHIQQEGDAGPDGLPPERKRRRRKARNAEPETAGEGFRAVGSENVN
ncbi:MAG: GntR family transcriptional regulator [Deltaproteobacteria bacterium]|nr:GntR family transcriptional regulator [Deltaproteobacteria bacterium]